MTTSQEAEVKPLPPRMSAAKLDQLGDERLELLARIEAINDQVKAQVEAYGFTPPRAEKSRRILGEKYKATVSYGESTEIRDTAVEVIRKRCPITLFPQLFTEEKRYKLASTAYSILAATLPEGAPPNLRQLFQQAVIIKPKSPSLRIECLQKDDD